MNVAASHVSPGVLAAIAAGLASTATAVDRAVDAGGSRSYTRLRSTSAYEAWLIAWASSGALDLHDHGGSRGHLEVVRGELVETYTDLVRQHRPRSRTIRAGDSLSVPENRVHIIRNPGPTEALSVHVYSPPLTSMTFFDHRSDRFLEPLHTQANHHWAPTDGAVS